MDQVYYVKQGSGSGTGVTPVFAEKLHVSKEIRVTAIYN